MKSRVQQTNSLINVGDFITIKTPLPIYPDKTIILGYYLLTNDIIDYKNYLSGEYALSPESTDSSVNENSLKWNFLNKTIEGENKDFNNACNSQSEPYYIYFRFTKIKNSGQIINIDKVSLKIADKSQTEEKYPFYDKSIFKEIKLYDIENLKWTYSVLDKLKSNGILPTFIEKDRDFQSFWGWLCHFFAVIVVYGRQFLDIFKDKNLFWEFLRQKDIYRDSRVGLYEDIVVYNNQELFYTPIVNQKIAAGYAVPLSGWIYSGLVPVRENNVFTVKVSNVLSIEYPTNLKMYVSIAFYNTQKVFIQGYTVELNKDNLQTHLLIEKDKDIKYVAISYKPIYSSSMIYLVKMYISGEGYFAINQNVTKDDLLNVYNKFRKRGTEVSLNSIKSLCETQLADTFYSNFIDKGNIGWFLNKSSPITPFLSQYLNLETFLINKLTPADTGEFVEFDNKYIAFSDSNAIHIKWDKNPNFNIDKVCIFCTLYSNGKAFYQPNAETIVNSEINGIVVENIPKHLNEIIIPLRLIENINQKNLNQNIINIDYTKEVYLFVNNIKYNNVDYKLTHLQLKGIYFTTDTAQDFINLSENTSDDYINRCILGHYLERPAGVTFTRVAFILNSITLSNTIKFTLNFYNNDELVKTIITEEAVTSFDSENGYKKIVVVDEENESKKLGVIIFRLSESSRSNSNEYTVNNPFGARQYLFFANQENKYDYIPDNALVDFGDAFSYYLKPGDILEHGNARTTVFDEIIEDGEVVDSRYSSLSVDFHLYKLPYNLGFLNISNYYLTYYKNHGKYSDEELEDIISQKFLPYNGYRLFVNSDKSINYSYKAMKFLEFNVINPLGWTTDTGHIYCTWKGGCPSYNAIISGKRTSGASYVQQYTLSVGVLDVDIPSGVFDITITDTTGNTLVKKGFFVSKPEIITFNARIYSLAGNKTVITSKENSQIYDEVELSLRGGTPPYKIGYTNKSNTTSYVYSEGGRFVALTNMKAIRNNPNQITVVDSNEQSITLTLLNDKYFEVYDNGEGSCALIN